MALQNSLFSVDNAPAQERIEGLIYISNFITPAEEVTLLDTIDQQPWLTDLKRRVLAGKAAAGCIYILTCVIKTIQMRAY